MTIDYSALMYLATISSRVPLSFKVSNSPFFVKENSNQHSFTAIYYRKLPFCLRNIPGQNEQLLFSNLLKIIYLCNKVIIDIAER